MAALCAAVAIAVLPGCTRSSSDSPISPSPVGGLRIEDIATSASAEDRQGVRRSGNPPAPSGGPRVTASGNQRVVTGGTGTVTLTADQPFDTVYLFVGGRSLGLLGESAGGFEGFYEITLPGPQTTASVLLTFPQEIPINQFDLQFAGARSGAVGPFTGFTTSVIGVGTGDVQVTLAWDVDSDVDLHVVGPDGEEIFYGRRRSSSGGELDLDSNAGCRIDGIRNENITWPVGRAPRGEYVVRVDYWSSCGVERTNYTVRINNGGAVQIMTGTLTGPGTRGGLGAGTTVATFHRLTGPAAVLSQVPSTAGSPAVTFKTPSPEKP